MNGGCTSLLCSGLSPILIYAIFELYDSQISYFDRQPSVQIRGLEVDIVAFGSLPLLQLLCPSLYLLRIKRRSASQRVDQKTFSQRVGFSWHLNGERHDFLSRARYGGLFLGIGKEDGWIERALRSKVVILDLCKLQFLIRDITLVRNSAPKPSATGTCVYCPLTICASPAALLLLLFSS